MKKVLAILAVVTLLMASTASATLTRVGGTGLPLWMITDDAQIVLEPSVLANNTGLAVMETDGAGVWGMVTADLGEGSSLGIYASWPEMALSSIPSSLLMMLGPLGIPTGTGLLYGMDLGDMGLTVGLAYGSAGYKEEEGETEGFENGDYETTNGWGLAVPVGLSLKGDMPIDLNLIVEIASIAMYEAKDYDDVTGDLVGEMYQGASMAIIVGLAGKVKSGDIVANISGGIATAPGAGMWMKAYDASGDLVGHNEMTVDLLGWNVNLGIADVMKPTDTITATIGADIKLLGAGITMTDKDVLNDVWLGDQTKIGAFIVGVPIYIAVEGKLNDTWSARGGVNKMLFTTMSMNNQEIDAADESTLLYDFTNSMTGMDVLNLTGGVTGTFGPFQLDLVIDYDVALDGPYFLSGEDNDLSFMVGGKYAWK